MKRIIALLLVTLLIAFALVGCGDIDRLNYVKGLKDKVELCDFENITIDRSSVELIDIWNQILKSDFEKYPYEAKEGTVKNGDITNIDYAGKVDGVAFAGGTAEGQILEIGSGSFIPGFEEQLVGVKIGDTVDIKVTFPADYHEPTLAGVDAVFTVKVNGIYNDEFAKNAGFDSAAAYFKDVDERCVKSYIYSYLVNNSTVKELPHDKEGNSYSYYKKNYIEYAEQSGTTFENILSSYGIDEVTFKTDVLTDEIIMYAYFDALGLEVTDEAVNAQIEEIAADNNVTIEEVKEDSSENYLEYIYVSDEVIETLYKKVKIVN